MRYCWSCTVYARFSQQSHGIQYLRVSATMNFYRHLFIVLTRIYSVCRLLFLLYIHFPKCNNNGTLIKESILIKMVRKRNSAMHTQLHHTIPFSWHTEVKAQRRTCEHSCRQTSTAGLAARFSECNFYIMSAIVIAINENITFSDRLTLAEASQSSSNCAEQ